MYRIDSTQQKKAERSGIRTTERKNGGRRTHKAGRDLHDAVSQTLFSTSLIAEVLPRLWERNKMRD